MSGNKKKTIIKVTKSLWSAGDNAMRDFDFLITVDLDKLPVKIFHRARIKGKPASACFGSIKVTAYTND